MTRSANARLAGFAYLLYIAAAIPAMLLMSKATAGETMAARLETMARHAVDVRIAALLTFLGALCALVLAVTLYGLTRDQDQDLALLGLTCRVTEGVTGAASIPATIALLGLASAAGAPDRSAAAPLATFVLDQPALVGATFFAVGSTLFCWLLLRGRMIPMGLAWLGVAASVLLVVCLPLQLAGVLRGPVTQLIWLPMAAFEIPLGVWWLVRGGRR